MKDTKYEDLMLIANFEDTAITINGNGDLRAWPTITSECCFARTDHIRTPEKLIKIEGNCPSCGAPITGEKCEYCGRVHYLRV